MRKLLLIESESFEQFICCGRQAWECSARLGQPSDMQHVALYSAIYQQLSYPNSFNWRMMIKVTSDTYLILLIHQLFIILRSLIMLLSLSLTNNALLGTFSSYIVVCPPPRLPSAGFEKIFSVSSHQNLHLPHDLLSSWGQLTLYQANNHFWQ